MDNIKDLVAIILCILTAYFVANAATVEGAVLYGVPAILLCAAVSFIVHWIVAIPSLVTRNVIVQCGVCGVKRHCAPGLQKNGHCTLHPGEPSQLVTTTLGSSRPSCQNGRAGW